MNWYRHLYTGKTVEKKKKRLIRELERGTYRGSAYLLTLAVHPEKQMELLPVRQLRFDYLRENCLLVVGIAGNREEALELLETIVSDVYEVTGGIDLRGYFDDIR